MKTSKLFCKEAKMRSKVGLLFLIVALLSFCAHPSATLVLVEHSQQNTKEKAAGEDFINNKYDQRNGSAITHESKFGHGASGGGGNGAQAAVSNGGNSGSHSPYVQGGGGVTPVYAAGAGNNHHNHHGGGNRGESRTWLKTLTITAVACFLVCMNKDW